MSTRVVPVAKMDMDSELRLLESDKGNYPVAYNCRVGFSEGRGIGAVENMLSALLIPNPDIDENDRYVAIGAGEDRMSSQMYFAVCDTKGTKHGLYRYNYLDGTIEKVYKDPSLNFSKDHIIHSWDFIGGTVYFTDDYNGIRQIIASDAIAGLYSSGIEDFISIERNQPFNPITCSTPTNTPLVGHTAKKSFQFIYRYVYKNGQKSRWSVPSNLYSSGYDSVLHSGVALEIRSKELAAAQDFSKIIAFVDVGFRTSDSGSWFFYKRFSFPSAVNSFIADTFLNDKAYAQIANTELADLYDNIPLRSRTLVVAENRLILGGSTYGYETPVFNILSVTVNNITPVLDRMYLNTGGLYGVCLLFYDALGRCMGAVPLDGTTFGQSVSIAPPSRDGIYSPQEISFLLGGVCPEWVAYYRAGITLCRNKTKFVDAFVTVVSSTVDKLVFEATFVAPTPPSVVWIYTSQDLDNNLNADRAAIKARGPAGTTIGPGFGDLPLTFDAAAGAAGRYTISKVDTDLPIFGGGETPLIEFFSPKIQGATEFFFEIPDTYVPFVKNGIRRYGDDFQEAKRISIGDGNGDTHYRRYSGNTTMTFGIEAMAANDLYYEEWQHNVGRGLVAPIDDPKQVSDYRNQSFSDVIITGTNVNGLNSFSAVNQNQIPVELGEIQRFVQATDFQINGSLLLCITSVDAISYYLNKVQFLGTNGARTFGLSDSFLNNGNLMMGNGGTLNPESVVAYAGRVYWWDVLKGIIWRYSNDGLTPISYQYGAKAHCNAIGAKSLKNRNDKAQICCAAFDPYFDEYCVYLNSVTDQANSKILAFNESKNAFSSIYEFKPEWMSQINQYMVSFKDGQLYVHRMGQGTNVVYGEKLRSRIGVVFNPSPNDNKVFESIVVEAQDKWTPVVIRAEERTTGTTPNTSSLPSEADIKEGDYWFPIKRATPDRINGRDIRGKYLYVELELDSSVNHLTRLYGVTAISEGSPITKENI